MLEDMKDIVRGIIMIFATSTAATFGVLVAMYIFEHLFY